MTWTIGFILFIYGAVMGSFLNVCIYRLPREESIVFPGSHCPICQKPILWRDNIPLLGWALLRGRCRQCQGSISPLYPLVELVTALLTVGLGVRFGLTLETLFLVILGYAFIVLTMIDFEHYILPDVITLPGIIFGLLVTALPWIGPPFPPFKEALIGVVAGGGGLWGFAWLFEKITGKVGMGFGDVKLTALIGAWMGWQALPFTIFVSALIGSVVGITWILIAGRDRHLPIPFGPYLIGGAWCYLYWGPEAYTWYFGLILH
ncbi:MAG: prepilin peptidase [Magnetococcus sp. DMHC-6]